MGVRPPQRDTDDTPSTVAFGIAALDEHVTRSDLTFPATSDDVLAALGDRQVPYDAAGSTVALSTVLESTPVQRFETEQELLNALHPVFEARRERAGNSIVGQLRSLLPF